MSSNPQQQHTKACCISALNHQGLSSLEQGNFEDAQLSFRKALDRLLIKLRQANTFAPEDLCVSSWSVCTPNQVQRFTCDDNYLMLTSNAFYFDYTEAYLPTSKHPEILPHQERPQNFSAEVVSACLLFNLGLSYHLKAVCAPYAGAATTSKLELLAKAMKCYHMGFETLSRKVGDGDVLAMPPLARSLLMAISNNQAHASLHAYDLDTCSKSVDAVRYLLQLEQQQDDELLRDEDEEELRHQQAELFLMNVILFEGHERRAAPAA